MARRYPKRQSNISPYRGARGGPPGSPFCYPAFRSTGIRRKFLTVWQERLRFVAFAILSANPSEAAQGRKGALGAGLALGAAGAYFLMQGRSQAAPIVEEEEVVYERRRPRYEPTCHMERRRVWLDEDSYTYRRVEVCQ